MRRYIFLFFMLGFSVPGIAQQNYATEQLSASLKTKATAILRNSETTVDMRAADQVVITVKKAITVLNENGNYHAQLDLFYNKNATIQKLKGAIYNSFGIQTTKISMSDFSDESAVDGFSLYQDYRLKHFRPKSLSYPYTVVYEYEQRSKQNLNLPDWTPNYATDIAIENDSFTFLCKTGEKIRIKEYNYKGQPRILKTDKTDSYTWSVANLPAKKPEAYSPDPDSYNIRVKIAPEEFSYYGHKGSYRNWEELGKWEYEQLIRDRQVLSPAVQEEIKAMVKDLPDDEAKARRIYEYVQKRTRYISVQIGIGGNQPTAAEEVHRLAYGDCKGLVNYMQSLLKVVDIPSLYCVVYAGSMKKSMDASFASLDQGNHIILCVPLKKDTVWLECTSQDAPFGYLGDFTDDRLVLACTAEGGKLLRTPALSTEMNLQKRISTLSISPEGDVSGDIRTAFRGSQYENYGTLMDEPYTEQLKKLKRIYDVDNIIFDDFKLSQQKDIHPVMSESLKVEIPRYAARSNERMYLTLNAFNKKPSIPETRTRTMPIYLNRGYVDEDELSYELPKGYELEAKPENKVIISKFGRYELTVSLQDQKLVYKRKLTVNNGTFPAESYEEFTGFMNAVSSLDMGRVVFKVKRI